MSAKIERQKIALANLKTQLQEGTKPKVIDGVRTSVPLDESDVKRIKQEIAVLEQRTGFKKETVAQ